MPLERVTSGFKDLSMSFQANPLTKDLIALKNENAIARSLKNIVFTLPGEKFFDPDFGSRISASLFENINEVTASIIVDEITDSIQRYEPRVRLLEPEGVRAFPNFDNNTFDVVIGYTIIGADVPAQQLEFVLESNR